MARQEVHANTIDDPARLLQLCRDISSSSGGSTDVPALLAAIAEGLAIAKDTSDLHTLTEAASLLAGACSAADHVTPDRLHSCAATALGPVSLRATLHLSEQPQLLAAWIAAQAEILQAAIQAPGDGPHPSVTTQAPAARQVPAAIDLHTVWHTYQGVAGLRSSSAGARAATCRLLGPAFRPARPNSAKGDSTGGPVWLVCERLLTHLASHDPDHMVRAAAVQAGGTLLSLTLAATPAASQTSAPATGNGSLGVSGSTASAQAVQRQALCLGGLLGALTDQDSPVAQAAALQALQDLRVPQALTAAVAEPPNSSGTVSQQAGQHSYLVPLVSQLLAWFEKATSAPSGPLASHKRPDLVARAAAGLAQLAKLSSAQLSANSQPVLVACCSAASIQQAAPTSKDGSINSCRCFSCRLVSASLVWDAHATQVLHKAHVQHANGKAVQQDTLDRAGADRELGAGSLEKNSTTLGTATRSGLGRVEEGDEEEEGKRGQGSEAEEESVVSKEEVAVAQAVTSALPALWQALPSLSRSSTQQSSSSGSGAGITCRTEVNATCSRTVEGGLQALRSLLSMLPAPAPAKEDADEPAAVSPEDGPSRLGPVMRAVEACVQGMAVELSGAAAPVPMTTAAPGQGTERASAAPTLPQVSTPHIDLHHRAQLMSVCECLAAAVSTPPARLFSDFGGSPLTVAAPKLKQGTQGSSTEVLAGQVALPGGPGAEGWREGTAAAVRAITLLLPLALPLGKFTFPAPASSNTQQSHGPSQDSATPDSIRPSSKEGKQRASVIIEELPVSHGETNGTSNPHQEAPSEEELAQQAARLTESLITLAAVYCPDTFLLSPWVLLPSKAGQPSPAWTMLQTLAGLVEVPEEALGSPAVSEPGGRLSYSSSSSPHSKAGTKARAGPGATAAAPSVGLRIPEEEGLHVQRLLAAAAWKVAPPVRRMLAEAADAVRQNINEAPFKPLTAADTFTRALAAHRLAWLVRHLRHPFLGTALPVLLPAVLAALGDPSPATELCGMRAMQHIAEEALPSELRWQGPLLVDTALRMVTGAQQQVLEAATTAATSLILALEGSQPQRSAALHSLISTLLAEVERNAHMPARRVPFLSPGVLLRLIPAAGLTLLRHTARLLPLLHSWLTAVDARTRLGAARATVAVITHTWPRMPVHAPALWLSLAACWGMESQRLSRLAQAAILRTSLTQASDSANGTAGTACTANVQATQGAGSSIGSGACSGNKGVTPTQGSRSETVGHIWAALQLLAACGGETFWAEVQRTFQAIQTQQQTAPEDGNGEGAVSLTGPLADLPAASLAAVADLVQHVLRLQKHN